MGGEDKYIKKVLNDRLPSERIAMIIPGFGGYKEKELRRDTDQLIRNKISATLKIGLKDLQWCYREIINCDLIERTDIIDRLIIKTDRINEKIYHAKRGYSGIWQAVKVGEEELYELMCYDASLLEISEQLKNDISQLKDEIKRKNIDEAIKLIDCYEMSIDDFDNKFTEREEVILGLIKGGDI